MTTTWDNPYKFLDYITKTYEEPTRQEIIRSVLKDITQAWGCSPITVYLENYKFQYETHSLNSPYSFDADNWIRVMDTWLTLHPVYDHYHDQAALKVSAEKPPRRIKSVTITYEYE
jgi:hypothetical protein